jgi:hypothetical protein
MQTRQSYRTGSLLAAAMLLAACDGGGEPTKVRSVTVGATNEHHEQLHRLSEINRGLALRRAVQDSGKRCKKPDASAFQGEYRGLKMWTLRCPDTGDWALFLAANGDIQVRNCKDLTQLGLPPCVTGPLED